MNVQNGYVPSSQSKPKLSKEEAKKKKKQRKIDQRKEKERKELVISSLYDMEIDEIKCGMGVCTPRWFQTFATAEWYLTAYCVVALILGMFFTYSVATISTYEKRFKLASKETGFMLSGNDISQILLGIIIAYYGNHGHRPRWVAFGCFVSSISCILAALPHFLYGPGQDAIGLIQNDHMNDSNPNKRMEDFCDAPYAEGCDQMSQDTNTGTMGPLMINFTSQFLLGIVVSVTYTIGFAYMDDNLDKKESPIYFSVTYMVRVIGPVLGYFLGSKCLAMFILPQYEPNISPRDPRWLGAWWLGYIVLSVLLAVGGILFIFFPRTLPITMYNKMKKLHAKKETGQEFSTWSDLHELHELTKEKEKHTKPSLKKLPSDLMRLLKNKIFVGNNINYVLTMLAFFSYWTFKPKFLEFQFRKSASEATLYAGIASLVASIFGFLISGIIIRVFKPRPKSVALYSLLISLWNPIMMFSLMLIGCPNVEIQGGPMSWSSGLGSCDSVCNCTERFSPVCSKEGGITYYSSCYAGCTGINTTAFPVEYYNCSCAPSTSTDLFQGDILSNNSSNLYSMLHPATLGGNVTQGYCPEDCDAFYYYLIVIIVGKIITATSRIGAALLFIRGIEERDKGLALGATTVFISLFAFIPAPIFMGAIVDSACIIWDNTCGVSGNCWLYDSDKFRIIIHAVPAVLFLFSTIGDIMVYRNCDNLNLYGDQDEENPPMSPPLPPSSDPPVPSAPNEEIMDKEMTPLTQSDKS